MSAMRPIWGFSNAVAGPSRQTRTPVCRFTRKIHLRLPTPIMKLTVDNPHPGHSQHPHQLNSELYRRSYASHSISKRSNILSERHRSGLSIRQYSTSSPSLSPRSSSTSNNPLLALTPFATSAPSESVDPAVSGSILDPIVTLLLSSPLPAGLTILLITFAFRSAVTLPATLWQRRRVQRTKDIIRPAMKELNERLAGVVAKQCRAKGIDYEGYKKELKSQLATHQSALHKKHKTHPLPTMLLPLFVHVPLIITLSLSIRRAIEAPLSPWAAESWWWLEHLGEVDPTMILPIAGGVLGMMNAEVVGRRNKDLGNSMEVPAAGEGKETVATTSTATTARIISPIGTSSSPSRASAAPAPRLPSHLSKSSRPAQSPKRPLSTDSTAQSTRKVKQPTPPPRPATPSRPAVMKVSTAPRPARSSATSHLQPIQPQSDQKKEIDKSRLVSKLFTNAMRVGAILFIPIAAQVPAALALYWTGSMVFTLVQNLTLDWLDAKKKIRGKIPGDKSGSEGDVSKAVA